MQHVNADRIVKVTTAIRNVSRAQRSEMSGRESGTSTSLSGVANGAVGIGAAGSSSSLPSFVLLSETSFGGVGISIFCPHPGQCFFVPAALSGHVIIFA